MKAFCKILAILLTAVCCFASCQNYEMPSEGSSDSEPSSRLEEPGALNGECGSVTNLELETTKEVKEYYPVVNAGRYLGADLPDEQGCYYREILTFEDFSALVENPNVLDSEIFDTSFVLVLKRKIGGYFADIGFKNYDPAFQTIELDSYSNLSQGTDSLKTRIDYIIVPKYKAMMDEDHVLVGSLQIKSLDKCYYEMYSRLQVKDVGQGRYFESIEDTNVYLTQKGYDEIYDPYKSNCAVLMLSLNMKLDFGQGLESSNLGFCNFNTNGSDIYITLERNIINGSYGDAPKARVVCVMIPKGEICAEISDMPSIHILVSDNLT